MKYLNWSILTVFGVALVANPYLACSSNEQDFTYSEQDMKSAMLGDWEGTADLDGESVSFTLTLEQASSKSTTQSVKAPTLKPQCGSRSFVKPAAACESVSNMPLLGTLASANPTLNGPVTGYLIASRILEGAELTLDLEGGAQLSGHLKSEAVSDGIIRNPSEAGSFALSRP